MIEPYQTKGRDEMKGYNVYSKIQQMQESGFTQRAVARTLGINRKTVKRYWKMPISDYENSFQNTCREKLLNKYQSQITSWLREYPTLTAAQVCDWLKEYYNESFSDRTVSRYVKALREDYGLLKHPNPRDYEAVPELPMGQQVQVDFGQATLKNVDGGWTKVYVAAFLLSRSRYKYAELQSRPFTAVDLVKICHNCFQYFGGMPKEMVFDQDSIVCVSENAGDIIFTYEFEKFRQDCKTAIYMCRGADPESKGKIENTVKYIKGNFLSNRLYTDDGILNGCCLEWLERTANAKVHGTTKLIPAEIFKEECEYLRPLTICDQAQSPRIHRTVRKDNTIIYDSNRYSVPLGTYNTQPEVRLDTKDGILYIQTIFGEPICEHRISSGRGLLIQSTNHRRDRTTALDKIQEDLDAQMGGKATSFLQTIRTEKSRYARDQFRLIQSLLDQHGLEASLKAIDFCQYSKIYSANTMKDYLEPQMMLVADTVAPKVTVLPVDDAKYHVTTQKRPLAVYAKVGTR